jgi:hypothetical protein
MLSWREKRELPATAAADSEAYVVVRNSVLCKWLKNPHEYLTRAEAIKGLRVLHLYFFFVFIVFFVLAPLCALEEEEDDVDDVLCFWAGEARADGEAGARLPDALRLHQHGRVR